jgi:hypothetical protein
MEPVYMILGHACGMASSMAIAEKIPVQAVSIERLTSKLLDQQSVLDPAKVPGAARAAGTSTLDPVKLGGIVVDDSRATRTGDWLSSSTIGPFVGEGYLHDGGKADGKARIRFTPKLPGAGKYEVRLYSTPNPNRATNTLVAIHSVDGDRTTRVDQRRPTQDGAPIVLGVFSFAEGEGGWVELRNEGVDGHVIADAVQFLPVK